MHIKKSQEGEYKAVLIIIIIMVLMFVVFLILSYMKTFFIILFFIIFGALSMLYQLQIRIPLGVDIIFIGTILCSIAYGPAAGILVGCSGLLIGKIITRQFNIHIVVTLITIAIIGFLPYYLYSGDIVVIGFLMIALYNIILLPVIYLSGGSPIKLFLFSSTHIIFNWWMIKYIAQPLLNIMM